jgi:hypothetical protein
MKRDKAAEKEQARARRVARFKAQLEGPPLIEAVATHPDSMEHWRKQVAETGMAVEVVADETMTHGRARFIPGDVSVTDRTDTDETYYETDARPDGPLRVIVHHPERSQSVRVKTGPEGTEVHIGEH